MTHNYLSSVRKQFAYYKQLGDQTFEQLTDEQLFVQPASESNSIAIIVQHLWGNMLSRWTDFLTTDGEKEWRNRDTEFEATAVNRAFLLQRWEEGWQCLFAALDSLQEADLDRIIYIRNQGHTVVEAINRQLAHYPYHVGQIVFLGKWLCNEAWQNLSIPRGNSQQYNQDKFAQPKQPIHFTDDLLKKKSGDTA